MKENTGANAMSIEALKEVLKTQYEDEINELISQSDESSE